MGGATCRRCCSDACCRRNLFPNLAIRLERHETVLAPIVGWSATNTKIKTLDSRLKMSGMTQGEKDAGSPIGVGNDPREKGAGPPIGVGDKRRDRPKRGRRYEAYPVGRHLDSYSPPHPTLSLQGRGFCLMPWRAQQSLCPYWLRRLDAYPGKG